MGAPALPTHAAGHILDVVISRSDTVVQQLSVGDFVSDHAVVNFKLNLRRSASTHQLVTRRSWRNFIAADFEADLAASRLHADLRSLADRSPDDLVALYDTEMTSLLDKHCPEVTTRQKQCRSRGSTRNAVLPVDEGGWLNDNSEEHIKTLTRHCG